MVFVQISDKLSECDVLVGSLDGNKATLKMLDHAEEEYVLGVELVFDSNTKATGRFTSCTGNCAAGPTPYTPIGQAWEINKIY